MAARSPRPIGSGPGAAVAHLAAARVRAPAIRQAHRPRRTAAFRILGPAFAGLSKGSK